MYKLIVLVMSALVALGCASTSSSAGFSGLEGIAARIQAEREECEQQDPRGSARCWFDLAVQRSANGDPYLQLQDMESVMKTHRLTFDEIGVTEQDVENVRRRGHLAEAKRAYELVLDFAPRHDVSLYVGDIYEHLAAGNLLPEAIEPDLTFEAIRNLERLGDLSEARKYLVIARKRPGNRGAVAAIFAIRRLLKRSGQTLEDLETGLTETMLDELDPYKR